MFQRVIKRMTKKHISNGRWLFDFSADFVDKFLVCVDTTFLLNFPSSLYSYYSHPFISPIPKTHFFHFFQFSNSRNEPFFFFLVIWCSCSVMHMLWFLCYGFKFFTWGACFIFWECWLKLCFLYGSDLLTNN